MTPTRRVNRKGVRLIVERKRYTEVSKRIKQKAKRMKVSVEKLFTEEFKPQWQVMKEAAELRSIYDALYVTVDFNYRKNAEEARRALSERYRKV